MHHLTRAEYDALVAKGCGVTGCDAPPVDVDHDHDIHPQRLHSCDECRRGVLCRYHNIFAVAFVDQLRRGELAGVLDYLGLKVTIDHV